MTSNYFVYLSTSVVEYKMSKHVFSNIEKIGYFQYLKIFTCYPKKSFTLYLSRVWKKISVLTNLSSCFQYLTKYVFTLQPLIRKLLKYNVLKIITKCFSALHYNFFCTQPYSWRLLYLSQPYWGFFFVLEKDFATFSKLFSLAFLGPLIIPSEWVVSHYYKIIK